MAEFNLPTRVATTALTTVQSVGGIVTARLAAGAANAVAYVHNTAGATSASTRVSVLRALANTDTELAVPVLCNDGVKVIMTVNTAELFIYIR